MGFRQQAIDEAVTWLGKRLSPDETNAVMLELHLPSDDLRSGIPLTPSELATQIARLGALRAKHPEEAASFAAFDAEWPYSPEVTALLEKAAFNGIMLIDETG